MIADEAAALRAVTRCASDAPVFVRLSTRSPKDAPLLADPAEPAVPRPAPPPPGSAVPVAAGSAATAVDAAGTSGTADTADGASDPAGSDPDQPDQTGEARAAANARRNLGRWRPTLIMAAASTRRNRSVNSSSGKGAGSKAAAPHACMRARGRRSL